MASAYLTSSKSSTTVWTKNSSYYSRRPEPERIALLLSMINEAGRPSCDGTFPVSLIYAYGLIVNPAPAVRRLYAASLSPYICQGTYDPIIAPARIFPRHLHNQALGFLIYSWTPYTSTEFRPIKFVRDELPIPTQNRFGLGRCRHVLQRLSTQAVTDLGQRRLFSFGKEQPTLDLASQNPVLLRQIFVSQQQFLIHVPVTWASRRAQSISDSSIISNIVKGKIVGAVSGSAKSIRRGRLGQNPALDSPVLYSSAIR
jgi:hypothetical protein